MRVEVIKCDECKKEHDAQYMLPREWVTLKTSDGFGSYEEYHLCSTKCLMEWASKRGIQVTCQTVRWNPETSQFSREEE